MRLRCLGSSLPGGFFAFALHSGQLEELEPDEKNRRQPKEKKRRKVFDPHQRSLSSMYNPHAQNAIAASTFNVAHGNVNVPATSRSSRENVNQRMPSSRAASAKRSFICVR